MKLSRLVLIFSSIFLMGSLAASEKCLSCGDYNLYMGYQWESHGGATPLLGFRYTQDGYITDLNVGCKIFPGERKPFHLVKTGINIFKILYQSDDKQIYTGVGAEIFTCRLKSLWGRNRRNYGVDACLTVGQHFFLQPRRNIFFEIYYKPYSWGKYDNLAIHCVGARTGIGF